MNFLNEIWNSFRLTVRGFDTPRQLALGVVFGMLVGLIPKDSLLPYAIGILGILSTGNLLSLTISAIAFSYVSPLLDPTTHQIGSWVLTLEPLQATWAAIYQLPMVPWTRFDNTVVMGSLILGICLTMPIHWISFRIFEKFGSSIFKFVSRTRVARWLIGSPSPGSGANTIANPAINPSKS